MSDLAKNGWPVGRRVGNGRKKLTDADVAAIRAARESGEPVASIAARFAVHNTWVYQLLRPAKPAEAEADTNRRGFHRDPPTRCSHRWVSADGVTWCDLCAAEKP